MAWYLGSTRIFVTGISDGSKQIVAKLQPVGGGTVYQTFGYEKPAFKIACKIVGEANLATVKALTTTGLTYVFSGYHNYGSVYVSSVNAVRDNVVCQTLTPIHTDPVFSTEIEVFSA